MSQKPKYFNKYPSLITLAGFPITTPKADIHIPQGIYISEGLHSRYLLLDPNYKKKSESEKALIKQIKKQHIKDLHAAGKNPKKHMNVTSL